MKDPFKQALDHRYDLERLISTVDGWRGDKLFIAHGLAFPYITIHQLKLAPDAPREILVDRNEIKEPAEAIERVLAFHRGARDKRRAPGEDGAAMLRDLLVPRVSIPVPMAQEFLEEEEQLVLLTHDQSIALRRMARDKRMVITGCAGSGKTMLAVEHAKRLAANGDRVLFSCFSKALAQHLRQREKTKGVDFFNFHSLCFYLAHRAGVKLPEFDGDPPASYWEEDLPEALVQAIDQLGEQYDALIVDEAQDFHTSWLDALMYTLRNAEYAPVWLFMDDNQRVYDVKLDVPREFRPWDLTVNCRNTQAIHCEVMKKYEGEMQPEALGPPGRDIELVHSEDQAQAVAAVLERLCGQEEIPPQDVVVLSSHGFKKSRVAKGLPGRYRLVDERGKLGNNVYCSSIRGFKGLESPVVVLCELEDLDDASVDQQLYVALSRAKNHCVVVVPSAPTAE